MITWFKKHAPIRTKFTVLIASNGMLGLIDVLAAFSAMQGAISHTTALIIALVTMLVLTVMMVAAKEWVSAAYVETVVRMESWQRATWPRRFPTPITVIASGG